MKLLLNPKYSRLEGFVRQLTQPAFFNRNGTTLHDGRNVIRLFEADGVKLVVKSYARLSLLNRLLYGTLRKSKAMRAYLHAVKLRNLGIDTPEEVAAVEVRRRGLLRQCLFVSLYTDYESVGEVAKRFPQHPEAEPILDALARFLSKVHWAGVQHKDLNIGNILYKREAGGYRFQLIDTNRMTFHTSLSMRQRLRNLRRLSCDTPAYLYILQRYAETIHAEDIDAVQLEGVVRRLFFEKRQRTKRNMKRMRNAIAEERRRHALTK